MSLAVRQKSLAQIDQQFQVHPICALLGPLADIPGAYIRVREETSTDTTQLIPTAVKFPNSFIILDRDGVINDDSADYIKTPAEWTPIPGSLAAIARFNQAGYQVAIASNQSGLARGLFTEETLEHIHHKMISQLSELNGSLAGIFVCPHHPEANCNCRKPKPGLLLSIAAQFKINLVSSFFIGDSLSDIQAARAANCQPVLVKTGKGLDTLSISPVEALNSVLIFDNLAQAATYIIGLRNNDHPLAT